MDIYSHLRSANSACCHQEISTHTKDFGPGVKVPNPRAKNVENGRLHLSKNRKRRENGLSFVVHCTMLGSRLQSIVNHLGHVHDFLCRFVNSSSQPLPCCRQIVFPGATPDCVAPSIPAAWAPLRLAAVVAVLPTIGHCDPHMCEPASLSSPRKTSIGSRTCPANSE